MKTPFSGGCQCGAISFTVNSAPLFTYACHCHSCQKRTGSACSLGLVIPTAALDIRGELSAWSRTSDAGVINTRYSCATCGNIIYGSADNSQELAKLQGGTLNDTSEVAPEVHMWTASKQPWIALAPEIEQFETQPDEPLALLQAALDYRASITNNRD